MSLLRQQDCPPQPWKNGLGSTRELAVYPSHAGSDAWVWRVSIATVDSAAPFSSFPGIDRHIVLLRGAGFRMTLDGERHHALDTPFAPFAFPGEAVVTTALLDGASEDFNLMVRRERAQGDVEVWRETGPHRIDVSVVLIYCAAGAIDMAGVTIEPGAAWQTEPDDPSIPVLHPGTVALAVRIVTRQEPTR